MLGWHRLDNPAMAAVLKLMIAGGLIRLGFVFWDVWSDNVEHDNARAEFLMECEAEEAASTCATYIENRDKDCFFASGLSSAQVWGEEDYHRCMWMGEAAYLKDRAARKAAQRDRYKGIMD